MDTDNNKQSQSTPPTGKRLELSAFGMVSAIGIDLAACTVGGTYLGLWLDRMWGTEPWMLVVGILVGLTGGILGIIKIVSAFGPESNSRK